MPSVWAVAITVMERWGRYATYIIRRFEVLAHDQAEAERIATEYLEREYRCNPQEKPYRIREVVVAPALYDVNAVRDGRVPRIRCTDPHEEEPRSS